MVAAAVSARPQYYTDAGHQHREFSFPFGEVFFHLFIFFTFANKTMYLICQGRLV